jgi:hypothetical protein
VPSATLSDGVAPIAIGSGSYQGRPNPHAWMGLSSALVYVDNIAKALSGVDPENAATYAANAEAYKAELTAAIGPLRTRSPPCRKTAAGWFPAKVPSATSPATSACKSCISGRSTPTSRARPARCRR